MSRRMSPKRMNEAVGAYFARCDGTRERVPQKGGGFQEVLAAAHGQGGAAGAILLKGLIRVAAYIQEKALLGELSATVAQAALKELGLTEGPAEEAMEPLQVILDGEAEAYSR